MEKDKINDSLPLVSVVVPVYGTEKWLRRCLDSIIWQSYSNIELICVDDASPDGCAGILEAYKNSDKRVKIIKHEFNKGLFATRISGVIAATGKYITFVDSDDYISCDWIRLLVQKAEQSNFDIVIGQWVYEDNGKKSKLNFDPLRTPITLEGVNVLKTYMNQQGSCFSWQLVWNKLYRKKLWDSALSDLKAFSEQNDKFTMCEDMAFSIAMWTRANNITNIIVGSTYFYCKNEIQSTNINKNDPNSFCKKLNDVARSFLFIKEQLQKCGKYDSYIDDYTAWKIHYAKTYYNNAADNKLLIQQVVNSLNIDDISLLTSSTADDYFFYSAQTECGPIEQWLEDIKINICYGKIKVISFDIFDTLLLRPFFTPTDLFVLLNKKLQEKINFKSFVDFARIRLEAEKNCREYIKINSPMDEDITLNEIYEQIKRDYNFPADIIDEIKNEELALELRYCYPRETAKQLYELARQQGKTIIFTSDMYLPKQFINTLLKKNGFEGNKIYISSDVRLTKWTGNLYKYISRDMQLEGKYFLHIGDNWQSDIVNAQQCGWEASHLAKPIDMLRNLNPGIYGGEAFNNVYNNVGLMQDTVNTFNGFLGLRCAAAIVANKIFDNPYITINKQSDYDGNAYWIGYSAIGTYLFAVTNWLVNIIKDQKSRSVQFVARDGYLPMKAYELFKDYFTELPESNYLYISRKSLCKLDIFSKYDLYSLINKLNIFNSSPKKMYSMFSDYMIIPEEELFKKASINNAISTQNFTSIKAYETFINIFGEYIDFERLNSKKNILRKYFKNILPPNSIMFDIGYSGRGESALSNLLGYAVNSVYIHSNSDILESRMALSGFRNFLFYEYKPRITGVVREHVFMKLAPSVTGYSVVEGNVVPTFESLKMNAATKIVTTICQNAALDFVKDFLNHFHNDFEALTYRKADMAMMFEYYLHYSKLFDRKIFSCIEFEDDFGLGKKVNAFDFWNNEINSTSLNAIKDTSKRQIIEVEKQVEVNTISNLPRWKKALYYFLFDRKTFWKKIKNRKK